MAPLAILGAQSGGANAVYENAISGGSSMKRRVYQSEQVGLGFRGQGLAR